MKIVAIGGGELVEGETRAIDEFSMSLTHKEHPRVLFIPTASGDSRDYYESVKEYFGTLGAGGVEALYLLDDLSGEEVDRTISRADLVYVGGGSTFALMEAWQKNGLKKRFENRYKEDSNFVLSGLSAGANCWFEFCTTDSPEVVGKEGGLGRMEGLGLVRGLVSPHHIREKDQREPFLPVALRSLAGSVDRAIVIDDGSAFVSLDGEEFYINSLPDSRVRVMRIDDIGNYHDDIKLKELV
jgi:dipeptidase E